MLRLFAVCLMLLQSLAQEIIEVNPDVVNSPNSLYDRVSIISWIRYSFVLAGDNVWHIYPEFDINVDLPFDQFVKVKYNACVLLTGACHMANRLVVDGVIDEEYTAHSHGSAWTPCNFRSGQIFLKKGTHRIYVQYRVSCTRQNDWWDWNRNYLKVEIFKERKQN